MTRPCQACGRSATFVTKHHHGRSHSDPAHDLCRRCWAKAREAANVADREAQLDREADKSAYWAARSAAA